VRSRRINRSILFFCPFGSLRQARRTAELAWLLLATKQGAGVFSMKMMLVVVGLVISAIPGFAQDQQTVAKLKADAEKLVKLTTGDKHKIQTYCEFADLSDQIGEANEDEDNKKADELFKKADELEKKLGPEFVALADELNKLDPNSEEAKEIGSILDKLDELCAD
jgi:hypothetical protein